jgi:hypothetical protein
MGRLTKRSKKSRNKTKKRRIIYGGNQSLVCPLPRCQCTETCNTPIQKGEVFCEYHKKNGCVIKGTLTGFEPNYQPWIYNNDKAVQHSHNCFAYAMSVYDKKKINECRVKNNCKFHVPGKTKGHPEFSGQMGKTCSDVIGRTLADVPRGYVTNFQTSCNKGYSKVAVVVDEKNDLHYYRQDKSGWWSHKPGGREVTNKDAYGAKIYRPDLASRCYPKENDDDSGLNYDSFCSYMCVPRDQPIIVSGGGTKKKYYKRL